MSAEGSSARMGRDNENVEDLLNRLDIDEDGGDDFIWEKNLVYKMCV